MSTEYLTCPWCQKGTVVVDGRGKVRFSCRCHECGHFIKVDAHAMTATRGSALKKTSQLDRRGMRDDPGEPDSKEIK